jgi:hypothetical protein
METHIRDHYILMIQNMGVTTKKYRVSLRFYLKLAISGKTVTLIDFEQKFEFFKNL